MSRPFRFGVVEAHATSRNAWVTIARRVEELGYATLLIPDRMNVGSLAPIPALAVAASATTSLRVGSYVFCNGYRHPVLLAREANIIAIGSKITARGVDPGDATLEQKIAWIKEAAGDRFADLELCQTIFDLEITDSGTALSSQPGGWSIPSRPLTTEQAVAHLLELRERYGFSYLQVSAGQVENFAPVVARLAGK